MSKAIGTLVTGKLMKTSSARAPRTKKLDHLPRGRRKGRECRMRTGAPADKVTDQPKVVWHIASMRLPACACARTKAPAPPATKISTVPPEEDTNSFTGARPEKRPRASRDKGWKWGAAHRLNSMSESSSASSFSPQREGSRAKCNARFICRKGSVGRPQIPAHNV